MVCRFVGIVLLSVFECIGCVMLLLMRLSRLLMLIVISMLVGDCVFFVFMCLSRLFFMNIVLILMLFCFVNVLMSGWISFGLWVVYRFIFLVVWVSGVKVVVVRVRVLVSGSRWVCGFDMKILVGVGG